MTELDLSRPILVTGGSGYIASWLVKYLLEEGYTVHATVRDKTNTAKCEHLNKMADDLCIDCRLMTTRCQQTIVFDHHVFLIEGVLI